MNVPTRLAIFAFLAVTTTWGGTVVLNFEGIAPYPNANNVFIQNYYNGGAASNGNIGPNDGVTFNAPALLICLNTLSTICSNTSRGGQGDFNSQLGGVFFLGSDAITMNVTSGFDTGFSFEYTAISTPGSVAVFDGLDGSGNNLASILLPPTTSGPCPGYNAGFCPFVPVGVSFGGVAESVVFSGAANEIVFDDITFGSSTPGGVPEPATLGLVGGALVFVATRFRRPK